LGPLKESTAARTDDVGVHFKFDLTYKGHISEKQRIRSDYLVRRNYHRLRKQIDVPLLHADREYHDNLSLRFRWKMAVSEVGLFWDFIPVFAGPRGQAVEKKRRQWRLQSSRFAYHYVINMSFLTIDLQAVFERIGLLPEAHLLVSFSVPWHLSTGA
jgi:hypothetical protein